MRNAVSQLRMKGQSCVRAREYSSRLKFFDEDESDILREFTAHKNREDGLLSLNMYINMAHESCLPRLSINSVVRRSKRPFP
jgi:hypothetical protein